MNVPRHADAPSQPPPSPLRARATLIAWALLAATLIAISLSPLRSGAAGGPRRGPGDVALYNAEIDRIRAGEGYYPAAAGELRLRGYPTRSVFNWRTPLPMWLIGRLPSNAWGQALLGALCLAVLLLGYEWLARETTVKRAVGCTLLAIGALLPCVLRGGLFAMPELWSGTLVALSIVAFALERRMLGLAAGIAALFFRELAAPYCLVALLIAVRERRRGEAVAWLAGLAAYAAFFAVHWATVERMLGPNDIAHPHGWVRLGGAAFVISTAQMNAYLLILPQWITALYFALAMLGLARWNSPAGQRLGLTVSLYVVAFGIVGQPFNQYWGCMFAPLLCFGAAAAPAALSELWKSAEMPIRIGRRRLSSATTDPGAHAPGSPG